MYIKGMRIRTQFFLRIICASVFTVLISMPHMAAAGFLNERGALFLSTFIPILYAEEESFRPSPNPHEPTRTSPVLLAAITDGFTTLTDRVGTFLLPLFTEESDTILIYPSVSSTESATDSTRLSVPTVSEESSYQSLASRIARLESIVSTTQNSNNTLQFNTNARIEDHIVSPASTTALSELSATVFTLQDRIQNIESRPQTSIQGGGGSTTIVQGASQSEVDALRTMISLTNRINTLDNVTLTNVTISGNSAIEGYDTSESIQAQFFDIEGDTITGSLNASSTVHFSDVLTLGSNLLFSNTTATITIPSLQKNAFTFATSSASVPFLSFDTQNYRIGIGTTSPGRAFSVHGSILSTGSATSSFSNGINVTAGCFSIDGSCVAGGSAGSVNGGTTNRLAYYSAGSTIDSAAFLTVDTTNTLLGIGTSTPSRRFSVEGDAIITGALKVGSLTATSTLTVPSLATDSILSTNSSGVLVATSTPSFSHIFATSTTATSTFSTGGFNIGSGQFVVQSNSGNVGIGTAGPSAPLQLVHSGDIGLVISNSNAGSNQAARLELQGQSATLSYGATSEAYGSPWNDLGFIISTSGASGGLRLGTQAAAPIIFQTDSGNTERMRINPTTGNVGIGTTSPVSTLSVLGESAFAGGASVGIGYAGTAAPTGGLIVQGNVGIGTTSPGSLLSVENTSSLNSLWVGDSADDATPFVIDESGNVGVGIATLDAAAVVQIELPSTGDRFELTSGAAETWFRRDSGGYISLNIGDSTGGQKIHLNGASDDSYFSPSAGNLGIGTTSPGARLDVSTTDETFPGLYGSNLKISSPNYPALWFNRSALNTGFLLGIDTRGLNFKTVSAGSATDRMVISNAGNVGIGETTPGSKLSVSGGATIGASYDTTAAPSNGLLVEGNVGIGTTSPGSLLSVENTSSLNSLWVGDSADDATPFVIDESGNVGVGTGAPSVGLDIRNAVQIDSTSYTSSANLYVADNGSNNLFYQIRAGSNFYVSNAGNVGIGQSAPVSKFDVYGYGGTTSGVARFYSDLTSASGLHIPDAVVAISSKSNGNVTTDGPMFLVGRDNSSTNAFNIDETFFTVQGSGNVGIGTTSPGTLLGVQGDIVGAGKLTVSSFSATSTTATSTFSTGGFNIGSGQFVVQSNSGNVGIGTAGPSELLHVASSSGDSAYFEGQVGIGTADPSSTLHLLASNPDIRFVNSGSASSQIKANSGALQVLTNDSNNVAAEFAQSGGVYLAVTQGNVGIGTTAPGKKLSVTSESSATRNFELAFYQDGNVAADIYTRKARGTAASPTGISANDRIGAWWAEGRHSGGGWSGSVAGIQMRAAESFTSSAQGTYIDFGTTPIGSITLTESVMRIDSTGNVGIGTTSPGTLLGVQGDIVGAGKLTVSNFSATSTTATSTFSTGGFNIGSGQFVVQSNSGNVGIGTANPDSIKLDVEDDIEIGTGTTGCVRDADNTTLVGTCVSDERLKKNITSLPSTLDLLTQLRPVTFEWRNNEYDWLNGQEGTNYGLIAQEVEPLFPEMVHEDDTGYKRVTYDIALTMRIIQGVKELDEELKALKLSINEKGALTGADGNEITPAFTIEDESAFRALVERALRALTGIVWVGGDWVFERGLNVGTRENPSGTTLYDIEGGTPYCVYIKGGNLQTVSGTCEDNAHIFNVSVEEAVENADESGNDTAPEDDGSTEADDTESDAEGADEDDVQTAESGEQNVTEGEEEGGNKAGEVSAGDEDQSGGATEVENDPAPLEEDEENKEEIIDASDEDTISDLADGAVEIAPAEDSADGTKEEDTDGIQEPDATSTPDAL